jgi:hypothetical protein
MYYRHQHALWIWYKILDPDNLGSCKHLTPKLKSRACSLTAKNEVEI